MVIFNTMLSACYTLIQKCDAYIKLWFAKLMSL